MAECSVELVGWWMLVDGREAIVVCAYTRTRTYVYSRGKEEVEEEEEGEEEIRLADGCIHPVVVVHQTLV